MRCINRSHRWRLAGIFVAISVYFADFRAPTPSAAEPASRAAATTHESARDKRLSRPRTMAFRLPKDQGKAVGQLPI